MLSPLPKTRTKEVRVTHSCRACKKFASELASLEIRFGYGAYGKIVRNERFLNADGTSRHNVRRTCECGHEMGYEIVKGRKTETPCGAKCLSSKGHVCECSCGGKNHGAGFSG